jgi:hypothetical protein
MGMDRFSSDERGMSIQADLPAGPESSGSVDNFVTEHPKSVLPPVVEGSNHQTRTGG